MAQLTHSLQLFGRVKRLTHYELLSEHTDVQIALELLQVLTLLSVTLSFPLFAAVNHIGEVSIGVLKLWTEVICAGLTNARQVRRLVQPSAIVPLTNWRQRSDT